MAIVALLYAPKSGKELRRDIKLKKDEFLDDTAEYMQIAKAKATELINEGKKKSEMLIQEAKKKATVFLMMQIRCFRVLRTKHLIKIEDAKGKFHLNPKKLKTLLKPELKLIKRKKRRTLNSLLY